MYECNCTQYISNFYLCTHIHYICQNICSNADITHFISTLIDNAIEITSRRDYIDFCPSSNSDSEGEKLVQSNYSKIEIILEKCNDLKKNITSQDQNLLDKKLTEVLSILHDSSLHFTREEIENKKFKFEKQIKFIVKKKLSKPPQTKHFFEQLDLSSSIKNKERL